MGVPWPYMEPNWVSAVSAWASKWMTETRPQPTCLATPVTSGRAMVWSPPRTTGIDPERATLLHGLLEPLERGFDLAREHLDVADVDHAQLDQGVDAQGQMGPAPVVGEVVGEPDRLGPEATSGPVRGAAVEGRPEDHRAGRRVTLGFVEIGGRARRRRWRRVRTCSGSSSRPFFPSEPADARRCPNERVATTDVPRSTRGSSGRRWSRAGRTRGARTAGWPLPARDVTSGRRCATRPRAARALAACTSAAPTPRPRVAVVTTTSSIHARGPVGALNTTSVSDPRMVPSAGVARHEQDRGGRAHDLLERILGERWCR